MGILDAFCLLSYDIGVLCVLFGVFGFSGCRKLGNSVVWVLWVFAGAILLGFIVGWVGERVRYWCLIVLFWVWCFSVLEFDLLLLIAGLGLIAVLICPGLRGLVNDGFCVFLVDFDSF